MRTGSDLLRSGDVEGAIEKFKIALDLDNNFKPALRELGFAEDILARRFKNSGEIEKWLDSLQRAAIQKRDYFEDSFNLNKHINDICMGAKKIEQTSLPDDFKPYLIIAAMPKSGSTFLLNTLRGLSGYREVGIHYHPAPPNFFDVTTTYTFRIY